MNVSAALPKLIATGLYSGCVRKAPGTVGSAACLLIWCILAQSLNLESQLLHLVIIIACCALGVWASRRYMASITSKSKQSEKSDPQEIVIDEWAGLLIALFGVSSNHLLSILTAFVFFRLFDILKPGPVAWVEKLPGAWGVMADDIVAGVLAAGCLHLGVLKLVEGV